MNPRELTPGDKGFLRKTEEIILKNLANEQFGVSELAASMGMSRSNLLRKIKRIAGESASQFIRNIRLRHALQLLKEEDLNISQVAFEVGFGSTSYFIKCFREKYGHPPGEIVKSAWDPEEGESDEKSEIPERPVSPTYKSPSKKVWLISSIAACIIMGVIIGRHFFSGEIPDEKSIAVLPFKNESSDSGNAYLVNGLMEAILMNLQKIAELRVISRTSVERYRNSDKTIPEMGKELNVSYFVEGSGQKSGDEILLHIQLIRASDDRHLWSQHYLRKTDDIFSLQSDIARDIASNIEVFVTPEEGKRISRIPTGNPEAYDLYLRGIEGMNENTAEGIGNAIALFEQAVKLDREFADASAMIAICYYYLDIFKVEKKYTAEINEYADKALFYEAELPQGLLAKAMYYMQIADYQEAIFYLEKALDFAPNSATINNFLSDIFTS